MGTRDVEGIVGAIVAMLKGKPYVYNIRDMYPDMAVGVAIVRPGLLARIWERLHRWALRRATRGRPTRRRSSAGQLAKPYSCPHAGARKLAEPGGDLLFHHSAKGADAK